MYVVAGCPDCRKLWVLSNPERQDTATCPRCQTRHRTGRLRHLFETDDRESAAAARTKLLAERSGKEGAIDDLPSVTSLESSIDEVGVDDRDYLEGMGIDPDEVATAGESRIQGGESRSQQDIVRRALRQSGGPITAENVIAYALDRGVPEERTRELLERLQREGEVLETAAGYRLL